MKYVVVGTLCKLLSRAHLIAAFALAAALIALLTLYAATITVDTLADGSVASHCTLHDAITAANTKALTNTCVAGTATDTIQFSVTGTIALSGTLPAIVNGETLTICFARSLAVFASSFDFSELCRQYVALLRGPRRVRNGVVNPVAYGRVGNETSGTAVFNRGCRFNAVRHVVFRCVTGERDC